MKRWVAVRLHSWAYRLEPQIGVWVRNAVIAQLAAQHEQQVNARQARLARHRENVAVIARNN